MKVWKIAALTGAVLTAAAAGAAMMPPAHAQDVKWMEAAPETQAFQIVSGGSRLGVSVRDVNDEDVKRGRLGSAHGVVIEDVDDESPAAKAGFKTGDIVVEFDGERVRSVRQFTRLVQETASGRSVAAEVVRDGQKTTLKVEPSDGNAFTRLSRLNDPQTLFRFENPALLARPARPPKPPTPPKAPVFKDFESYFFRPGTSLGITVSDLSPQLAEYFGTKDGVLVSSVNDDSIGAKAGLKAGDVLTSINGTKVNDPSDVRRVMNGLAGGAEFTLEIMRDKRAMTLKGKTGQPQNRRKVII